MGDRVYERLNRVREARFEYERMRLKIEELEALATKITPVLSDMPKNSGSHKNKTEDIWVKLADYKTKCQDKIDAFIKETEALEEELQVIRDPRIATAMRYRYIDGMSIENIALAMKYEERSVFRFLDKGKKIYTQTYAEGIKKGTVV